MFWLKGAPRYGEPGSARPDNQEELGPLPGSAGSPFTRVMSPTLFRALWEGLVLLAFLASGPLVWRPGAVALWLRLLFC